MHYISTDVVDFLLEVLKNLDICAAMQENQRIHVNLVHTGCAGRPSYDIGEDLLCRFLKQGFHVKTCQYFRYMHKACIQKDEDFQFTCN